MGVHGPPAVLSVLVWAYYPLLRGMVMAFQDYRILGGTHFVGFDNFIQVMSQDAFWKAVFNSFLYVGLSLGMGFFVPIILALMLAEVPRARCSSARFTICRRSRAAW